MISPSSHGVSSSEKNEATLSKDPIQSGGDKGRLTRQPPARI
jgi:hypothetical protein